MNITHFVIYRNGKVLIEVDGSAIEFKDMNITIGKNYTYSIIAVSEYGASAMSKNVKVYTTTPVPTTNSQAQPNNSNTAPIVV